MDRVSMGQGIPESVLKMVVMSVLGGLKYLMDSFRIIHGDIKPANILISKYGQVKLCIRLTINDLGDFGICQ